MDGPKPNGAFTLHGTGTGNGTGKKGFLYIMQNCSHCMEGGPGVGVGPENLAMDSPIFPVPFQSRFRAV